MEHLGCLLHLEASVVTSGRFQRIGRLGNGERLCGSLVRRPSPNFYGGDGIFGGRVHGLSLLESVFEPRNAGRVKFMRYRFGGIHTRVQGRFQFPSQQVLRDVPLLF